MKQAGKLSLIVLLALMLSAFAGQEGGGGNWTEGDFKHFLNRLIPYMSSQEGLSVFPEVKDYNQEHPNEPFEKVLADLNPRLVNGPVYDRFGNERDCVSGFDSVRFFKCNQNTLPPRPDENASNQPKSEYYGSLYRLALHEAFVQVGLEKPLSKEVASEYALASRLSVHLESFPEWVPGKSISGVPDSGDLGQKQIFTLTGAKGVGQTNEFSLCEYQARPDGTPIMGTLRNNEDECLHGKLNNPLSIYPGHYILNYSFSARALIEITPKNDLSLPLIPLPAPKASDTNIKFSIFYDYSNEEEFNRVWSITILVPSDGFYSTLQPGTWGYLNVKPFFDSGDPKTITPEFRNLARTDLGQTCMIYANGSRRNCHLEWIANMKTGDFISVLPGTYGIQWKFPDGHINYQRGIVIH